MLVAVQGKSRIVLWDQDDASAPPKVTLAEVRAGFLLGGCVGNIILLHVELPRCGMRMAYRLAMVLIVGPAFVGYGLSGLRYEVLYNSYLLMCSFVMMCSFVRPPSLFRTWW
jgi:hypothetical protein